MRPRHSPVGPLLAKPKSPKPTTLREGVAAAAIRAGLKDDSSTTERATPASAARPLPKPGGGQNHQPPRRTILCLREAARGSLKVCPRARLEDRGIWRGHWASSVVHPKLPPGTSLAEGWLEEDSEELTNPNVAPGKTGPLARAEQGCTEGECCSRVLCFERGARQMSSRERRFAGSCCRGRVPRPSAAGRNPRQPALPRAHRHLKSSAPPDQPDDGRRATAGPMQKALRRCRGDWNPLFSSSRLPDGSSPALPPYRLSPRQGWPIRIHVLRRAPARPWLHIDEVGSRIIRAADCRRQRFESSAFSPSASARPTTSLDIRLRQLRGLSDFRIEQ